MLFPEIVAAALMFGASAVVSLDSPPAKLARRLNLRLPRIARSRPLTAAGSPRDLPMRRPSRCARAAQAFPEAQRRAYFRPFTSETGVRVRETTYDGGYGHLEARLKGEKLAPTYLIPSVLVTKENAKEFYFPDSPF